MSELANEIRQKWNIDRPMPPGAGTLRDLERACLEIEKVEKANSILRAAMYDIIELESGPHTATVVAVVAENALTNSALDENGLISMQETCKDQGDDFWDCAKLSRCVKPQCADCPQRKSASAAEPANEKLRQDTAE